MEREELMDKVQELATEISNLLFENHEHFVTVIIDEDRFNITEALVGIPMNRHDSSEIV